MGLCRSTGIKITSCQSWRFEKNSANRPTSNHTRAARVRFLDDRIILQLWQLVTLKPVDLQRPTVPLWQGWAKGHFFRPKQKQKQKEKNLLPSAEGRSRRFKNHHFSPKDWGTPFHYAAEIGHFDFAIWYLSHRLENNKFLIGKSKKKFKFSLDVTVPWPPIWKHLKFMLNLWLHDRKSPKECSLHLASLKWRGINF